jgi:hypothetical protein
MEDIKIPIDKQLDEFGNHILANPRTFLSSKFGDGKSYFLDKFKKRNAERFVFITLYPVNYQVANNEDIFNLIKRDVLFQLIVQGFFEDSSIQISDELALWGFIQNKYKSFLLELLPYMASVALPAEYVPVVTAALKRKEVFKSIKKQFDDYKRQLAEKDDILTKFLDVAESNPVYEEDLVTSLIKQAIQKFKEKSQQADKEKRVVLIVEDLDRLDPAHLFRILNIFSAHIDYCYKLMNKPNETLVGNKFSFNNVVFVADFSNIRKIFKHFYGEQTDFNGYIGKFLSSAPYNYSIREIRKNFIYDYLERKITCPRKLIEAMVTEEMLESKTIRECIQAFDISSQVVNVPKYKAKEQEIELDITILKLLSIMRRLKIENDEIIKVGANLFYVDEYDFYKYVAPIMLILNDNSDDFMVSIYVKGEGSRLDLKKVFIDPKTGLGGNPDAYILGEAHEVTDFRLLFSSMLEYIVK